MPLIDLVRHGETVSTGFLNGRTDVALSERGREQAGRQTAQGTWTRVITSPRVRARATAEVVAARLGLPLEVDADWAEVDLGDWDGKALADLRADAEIGAALQAYYADPTTLAAPNGETHAQFEARVRRALDRVARDEGNPLIIAHAGSIRACLSITLGIAPARLWGIRIDYATRLRLNMGGDAASGFWGEIVEIAQS